MLNFFEYGKVRDERRRGIIALKQARRVILGRYLSSVFENRDTMLFQIQGMCPAERITDEARVQDEIDVYGALLPEPASSSRQTMMIEIADKETGKLAAVHFVGFAFSSEAVRAFAESSVSLVVDHAGERGRTFLSRETKAALLEDLRG